MSGRDGAGAAGPGAGGRAGPPPPPAPRPVPPPPPPPPPTASLTDPPSVRPTAPREREPILDVLRGFALCGILLVNIEFMRGPDFYQLLAGAPPDGGTRADEVTHFLVGWLATGKFISSFSLMFGLGAALIAHRLIARGRSPRGLLARRYGWLIGFGLAHMLLLFPGDILFAYGLTGMLLLAFVRLSPKALVAWSAGILAILGLVAALFAALSVMMVGGSEPVDDPFSAAFTEFALTRADAALDAHHDGSYLDLVIVNAWESLVIQVGQLFVLPWILALFLLGFAVGRSGALHDLAAHRGWLRRGAIVGLGVGLPLNLPLGAVGTLGAAGVQVEGDGSLVAALAMPAQVVGAPLLAIGYLCALTLLCLRLGAFAPLAAVGRMALSAYLAQSVVAVVVFWGFGRYDRLSATAALGVVVGTWIALLVVCPLWLRRFRFGPAEWLWRTLTYGDRQPMRVG